MGKYPYHTAQPLTLASFRTWGSSRELVVQDLPAAKLIILTKYEKKFFKKKAFICKSVLCITKSGLMKLLFQLLLLFIFAGPGVMQAQEKFTVYEKSSAEAQKQWSSFLQKGPNTPRTFLVVENADNAYDKSLAYLMQAMQVPQPDSVIYFVNQSVMAVRDQLDTNRYELPLSIQNVLSRNLSGGRGQLLDGLAQLYYMAPWQCSYFIQEKEELSTLNKDEPMLAFALLNRALLYSEVLSKPDRALPLIDNAIAIWTKLGNNAQLANNIKARGIAKMRMKKYTEAGKEIKEAMGLFARNDLTYGVTSCQLDLVLLYAKAGEPDSMKKYDQLCRPEFEAGDTMRLFVLNTNRLAAFQTANQYSIRDLAKQNADLLFSAKFHPVMVIEYYKTALRAFKFFGETTLFKSYTKEYESLMAELIKQGYWPGLF